MGIANAARVQTAANTYYIWKYPKYATSTRNPSKALEWTLNTRQKFSKLKGGAM